MLVFLVPDGTYFDPDLATVERVVSEKKKKTSSSTEKRKYLVKFKGLQYMDMTWEDASMIDSEYPEL
jgi:hypothetical protein